MRRVGLGILFVFLLIGYGLSCKKETHNTPHKEQTRVIQVSGNLSFDSVKVQGEETKELTIKNAGTGEVQIKSISCPDGFSVNWASGRIGVGDLQKIQVKFSPTEERLYSGKIVIRSDADSSPDEIQVSGTGEKKSALLSVSKTDIDFGNVFLGDDKALEFHIRNTGDATLTIKNITTPGPDFSMSYEKKIPSGESQTVSLKFSPTKERSYSGIIKIQSNGGDAKITVSGKGKAKPKAVLAVSPTSFDFGEVTIGDNEEKSFVISNTGNATLKIKNITSSSSVYTFKFGKSITAGKSQTIKVKFSPLSVKKYAGTITIVTNVGKFEVTTSGNGTAKPKAVLSVSPTSLDFGDVTVGKYKAKSFTIANTGNATLTIKSITSPGSAFTFNYKKEVAAGSSQEVSVKFSPESTQNYSGSIKINTNGGEAAVSVSGKGIAKPKAVLSVSPTSLEFGEVVVGKDKTKSLTIGNTGDAALTINSIKSSNSAYIIPEYNNSLSSGSSQSISVQFVPTSAESYTGDITIKTNAGSEQVPVSGSGKKKVKPILEVEQGYSSLDFGAMDISKYTYIYQTFHLYNTGNAPLTISSIRINNKAFTIPKFNTPTVIAAHSNQLIEVRFTPEGVGSYNGTLKIISNGGNANITLAGEAVSAKRPILSVSPRSIDFGKIPVGNYKTEVFTITNTGNGNLIIESISLPSSVYTINGYNNNMPSGSSQQITIRFSPTSPVIYLGAIEIETNVGNKGVSISGSGTAKARAVLSISQTSLYFGNTTIGYYSTKVFTITNTGNSTLTINSITMPGSAYSLSNYIKSLSPGMSQKIKVKFSPTNNQNYDGILTIKTNAGSTQISVYGSGVAQPKPIISVSSNSLYFGNITVGYYITKTLTISNIGNATLWVKSINVPSSSYYPIFDQYIEAGKSQEIKIKFAPHYAQPYNGLLTINTNIGSFQINIFGKGIASATPVLKLEMSSYNFGNVNVGNDGHITFSVYNTGNAPLKITGFHSNNNSFTIPFLFPPMVIAAGNSKLLAVQFTPGTKGNYSGVITLYSNGGNVNFYASGTGVSSTCNPIATPSIGYYPSKCDVNNGPSHGTFNDPQTGIIEAGVTKIDCENNSITFQFKRCDGRGFLHGGKVYVVSSYGNSYTSYPISDFYQGGSYQAVTLYLNKSQMAGTQTYYVETYQDRKLYPGVEDGSAVSNKITVTY